MKIIILGAGTVGSTLAISLSKEDNDITVVDEVPAKLHHLEEDADLSTIVGSCSYPSTLVKAGIQELSLIHI